LSAINFLPIAGFIGQDIPEVNQVVRVKINRDVKLRIGNEIFTEKDFGWTCETIFDFSICLLFTALLKGR
jgi:hypothetical protein